MNIDQLRTLFFHEPSFFQFLKQSLGKLFVVATFAGSMSFVVLAEIARDLIALNARNLNVSLPS